MRGTPVDADTAARWGLIDDVVTPQSLDATSAALAGELAAGATFSLTHTKSLLNNPSLTGIDAALSREAASVEATIRSADFFAERRDPDFSGN